MRWDPSGRAGNITASTLPLGSRRATPVAGFTYLRPDVAQSIFVDYSSENGDVEGNNNLYVPEKRTMLQRVATWATQNSRWIFLIGFILAPVFIVAVVLGAVCGTGHCGNGRSPDSAVAGSGPQAKSLPPAPRGAASRMAAPLQPSQPRKVPASPERQPLQELYRPSFPEVLSAAPSWVAIYPPPLYADYPRPPATPSYPFPPSPYGGEAPPSYHSPTYPPPPVYPPAEAPPPPEALLPREAPPPPEASLPPGAPPPPKLKPPRKMRPPVLENARMEGALPPDLIYGASYSPMTRDESSPKPPPQPWEDYPDASPPEYYYHLLPPAEMGPSQPTYLAPNHPPPSFSSPAYPLLPISSPLADPPAIFPRPPHATTLESPIPSPEYSYPLRSPPAYTSPPPAYTSPPPAYTSPPPAYTLPAYPLQPSHPPSAYPPLVDPPPPTYPPRSNVLPAQPLPANPSLLYLPPLVDSPPVSPLPAIPMYTPSFHAPPHLSGLPLYSPALTSSPPPPPLFGPPKLQPQTPQPIEGAPSPLRKEHPSWPEWPKWPPYAPEPSQPYHPVPHDTMGRSDMPNLPPQVSRRSLYRTNQPPYVQPPSAELPSVDSQEVDERELRTQ
ncbi:hypothetical protein Vretimale_9221 [Volvox reticuliferus]|uniref:Uncharacterized protein n=1 Tax=Volvox reticuliferus TaxID=1737510 RepID=A0A8J4CDD2_9CHLO|nr:hypothetical protein Vretifemale_9955 [Volvox reticuliferus]GIM04717.1 hypothetical protein Vretimale_9221 [Volvox reticuliferus]